MFAASGPLVVRQRLLSGELAIEIIYSTFIHHEGRTVTKNAKKMTDGQTDNNTLQSYEKLKVTVLLQRATIRINARPAQAEAHRQAQHVKCLQQKLLS